MPPPNMVAPLLKALAVVCPSCDFLNVAGAVRCMSCGAATDGSQVPARSAPAPAAAAGAPPGLRRSGTGPVPVPEALGDAPPSPSGAFKGPPARPSFQSTAKPATAAPAGPRFGLTVLAGPARGQRFKLSATGAQIGRSKGAILFPEDPFVSALHATLAVRDGKLLLRDEDSASGVFVSVGSQETVPQGGTFSTGLRLFRYLGALEPAAPWNRTDVLVYGAPLPNNVVHYAFEEVLLGGRSGRCLITPGPVLTVGQGKCDFSYPNDEGLAQRHCEISPMPNGAMVRDLSGGLGTFVQVKGERALKAGDRLRVGQQTLQVEALA